MFGIKLWYSGPRGWTTCTRCGNKVRKAASPYWGAAINGDLWCALCLLETGRDR